MELGKTPRKNQNEIMTKPLVLKSNLISKTQATRLYQLPVPVIGLTGGIATGKTTVAQMLMDRGLAVISADKLVKNIYATAEAKNFIQQNYPQCFKQNDQSIDFKTLRKLVFENPKIKTQIENFIYQRMPAQFTNAFQGFSSPQVIVYDVPLLFEKQLNHLVDLSVCVYLSKEEQILRLMKRDQIERQLAEKILNEQLPIDEKKRLSDMVIENNSSLDDLQIAVDHFINQCF